MCDVVLHGFAAIEVLELSNVVLFFCKITLFQNERKQLGIGRGDYFVDDRRCADVIGHARELFAFIGADSL